VRPGRSLARIGSDDLVRLAGLAGEVEAGLFARNPDGARRYAGRLVCRALCQGPALHYLDDKTGVKDFDMWSFYARRGDGPFPDRWRERLITVPLRSAAVPVTRYRSPAAGWICPAAPSRCRRTPTRPRSCATTCLPRGPPRRGSWLPGRPCSSVPGRSPGRSSGRPALRAGMLNARDSLDGVRDHSVRRRTRLHGTRSSGQRSQSDSRTWPTSRCKPHKYPPFGSPGSNLLPPACRMQNVMICMQLCATSRPLLPGWPCPAAPPPPWKATST